MALVGSLGNTPATVKMALTTHITNSANRILEKRENVDEDEGE